MKNIISLALLSLSALAFGQDGAAIENVNFFGNGCKEDEAMVVLSPNQQVLSLLFDNYIVEAGGENNARRGYKECMVKVKISVAENTRVVIEKIDYRGYAILPSMGRMNFSSSYYIDVPKLNFRTKTFTKKHNKTGELDEDLFFEQKIRNRVFKSKCGHDFSLNFESELMAMSNRNNDEVYVALDSVDTGIDFHMRYEACEQSFNRTIREEEQRQRQRIRAERRNEQRLRTRELRRERRMRRSHVRTRVCSDRDCVRNSEVNRRVRTSRASRERNNDERRRVREERYRRRRS